MEFFSLYKYLLVVAFILMSVFVLFFNLFEKNKHILIANVSPSPSFFATNKFSSNIKPIIAPAGSLPVEKDSDIIKSSPVSEFSETVKVAKKVKYNQYGIAAGGNLIFLNQSELEDYFKNLKDLGVSRVRWDLDWGAIQPRDSHSYDWKGSDRVVQMAEKYGIKSLGIITYTPKWAQVKFCAANKQCPPADANIFAKFAGEVAKRYKNSITDWEIWNEPNYNIFWYPSANVKQYVVLLKASYLEIKKNNPKAVIISGGLAASGDDGGAGIYPITFVNLLYKLGAQNYFDAIALHPYNYPASLDYKVSNNWRQINLIRQIMVDHGDAAKKIWLTEYGAPTNGLGTAHSLNQFNFKYGFDFMSENAQKQMVEGIADFYGKNVKWLGPFFWYNLRDSGNRKENTENFFGLIRSDGSKKPAYDQFKKIISKIP